MKKICLVMALLLLLSACGPKEAVTPTPQPSPTQPTSTPTPSPTPKLGPEPVCILEGEEIVSLCGTAFSHDAMLTADGKLLAWRETPFDLEKCVLRQDNGGYDIYELPLENITGAWLGRSSILALDKDGVLWGMGSNLHGQLWDAPEHEGWETPVKVTDHVVSAIISQWSFSAAVKDDGGVWLMGSGTDMTGENYLPPTRIAEVKGAKEVYAAPFLYVRDEDGVSWRLGKVDELLADPTALMSDRVSGGKWIRENLWLSDEGDLIRIPSDGEEQTLLANVTDVDLSYDVYTTAVTKDGDLYVWNEEETAEYEGLSFYSPAKVMEGVKLAGAWEHGVVVVTQVDGAVWAIYRDTLEAAVANDALITLPD